MRRLSHPGIGSRELIHDVPVPPAVGSYLDTEVALGVRTRYELFAVRSLGQESMLDSATVVRAAAVTEFSATSTGVGVELAWRIADRSGLVGLGVTRSPAGAQEPEPINGDSLLAANVRGFLDTTFEPGNTYEYRLIMHYGSGETVESAAVRATAPNALALEQNAPNPFNPATRIRFLMPGAGQAEVAVFDVRGRRVRTLLTGEVQAGVAETSWDGRDEAGAPAASGIYFCRLSALGSVATRKMALLR